MGVGMGGWGGAWRLGFGKGSSSRTEAYFLRCVVSSEISTQLGEAAAEQNYGSLCRFADKPLLFIVY